MRSISLIDTVIVFVTVCVKSFLPCTLSAAEAQEKTDPARIEIQALIHRADSLIQAGRFDTSIVLSSMALERAEAVCGGTDTLFASALNVAGLGYLRLAKHARAESFFERALEIREAALGADHLDVAQSLNNLAILYGSQGRYHEASSLIRRALTIRETRLGPDHPGLVESLNALAFYYGSQSMLSQMKALFERSLAICERALEPDDPLLGKCLQNVGIMHRVEGRYAEAEHFFRRALAIHEKALGSAHPNVALSLMDLMTLYMHQGKYAEAAILIHRAMTILEDAYDSPHPHMSEAFYLSALLCKKQGKLSEVRPLLEKAVSIWEKALGPDHPRIPQFLDLLAELARERGEYAEAESLYRRSLEIYEQALVAVYPTVARSLLGLGFLYREQGRYSDAESLYLRAVAILEKALGPDHPETANSYSHLAKNYCSRGDASLALRNYQSLQRSRQNFIANIFSHASEGQKARYLEMFPLIDHSFLSYAVSNPTEEAKRAALEMILRGKAAVVDAVSAEREIAYCSYDEEILETLRTHALTCGEIATLALSAGERLTPEAYRDRYETLYAAKDSLETELSASCSEFRDELASERFSLSDIEEALPEGSVLWEFFRYDPYDFGKTGSERERTGPPRYMAFTLDHAGNVTLTDLGDAVTIDSLVGVTRKTIDDSRAVVHSHQAMEAERRLARITGKLYERIFAPLVSSIDANGTLFISPDGQLNLLPFEILPCPNGEYVIEKHVISYLSSGRDLLQFPRERTISPWALVMANPDFDLSRERRVSKGIAWEVESDLPQGHAATLGVSECIGEQFTPLPSTQEEMEDVARVLREKAHLRTESYSGKAALEEILKRLESAPKILHLATHGYFCEDIPQIGQGFREDPLLRSGLVLAGANFATGRREEEHNSRDDGILTAFEVSGLNLVGTELAVLSACETGLGEVKNGEGVYGLRRAFHCAGARTVVMSLWKVPDNETSRLMRGFYEHWLAGYKKLEALRLASLELLRNQRQKYNAAHPLLWGGFVLMGDPD